MARIARGKEILATAQEALGKAHTLKELRAAQSVVLPLVNGFTMEQVAAIIGVSRGWACQLRNSFIRTGGTQATINPRRGGRRHENMSKQEEVTFLSKFIDKAKEGGILIVSDIRKALEAQLGRKVALSSVYNLLHRHNWRKIVPDKQHPRSNPVAQEEWKKNFQNM
jgi:transposase